MRDEKIIVNLYAEWNEEKQGWYVDTNYNYYFNDECYHAVDSALVNAPLGFIPIISLLEFMGYNAGDKIEGEVLEQIDFIHKYYKYK